MIVSTSPHFSPPPLRCRLGCMHPIVGLAGDSAEPFTTLEGPHAHSTASRMSIPYTAPVRDWLSAGTKCLDGPTVSRQFRRLLKEVGFRPIRFHDLRHVCASLLSSQGTHPRLVIEMLGHSTISVTMNTYSHVVPPLRNEVADQTDAVFTPVATQVATLLRETATANRSRTRRRSCSPGRR